MPDPEEPSSASKPSRKDRWTAAVRRALWLDNFAPRTKSAAYRHSWAFRSGDRKEDGPSLRAFLLIVALGLVIAVVITVARPA